MVGISADGWCGLVVLLLILVSMELATSEDSREMLPSQWGS